MDFRITLNMEFKLKFFSLPQDFRGRNPIYVQFWWLVQSTFFSLSPQFMYAWRRWLLRKFGADIGKGVLIRPSAKFTYPWKVTVGDNSWIGDNVDIYSLGYITIGKNSIISQKSYLCSGTHNYHLETFDIEAKSINIGDSVWVATDVFIAPGVTINNSAVIGARSSVFSDIEANTVCMGCPAKPVKKRVLS